MINRSFAAVTLGCAAFASLAAVAFPGSAEAKSPWMVRGRLITVLPDEEATVSILGGDVDIDTSIVPELDITYFFDEHWAAELILGVTPHEITHKPSNIDLGNVWLLPPTLTLQYHLQPDDPDFRPYIGAGVNYTVFFGHDDADPVVRKASFDPSFGFALQAGVDIPIGGNWTLNIDVKKVWINTEATIDTTIPAVVRADVDIDPVIVGVGLGYRW
jgi:outer membrane protein